MSAAVLALALLWNFDRTYTPQPERFVISYTAAGGQPLEAMEVAPSAPGACAGETDAAVYCAQWPSCPPIDSIIGFWVHAEWGDVQSERTNLLTCHFVEACVCTPIDTTTAQAPQEPEATAPVGGASLLGTLPVLAPAGPPAPT